MPQHDDHLDTSQLTIPRAAAGAARMAHGLLRPSPLTARILAHQRPGQALGFSERMLHRFDELGATGSWAADLAERITPQQQQTSEQEMTLAPFAPPQRQISTARQGAPAWSGGGPPATSPLTASSAEWPTDISATALLSDLARLGWGGREPAE